MKERRITPTGEEVSNAIKNVLDKAVNADSPNAPKQMRMILTEQNPNWKLPERRVAKYLKRILKSRKDPSANDIFVNEDEISLALSSTSSKGSFFKRFKSSKKKKIGTPKDNLLIEIESEIDDEKAMKLESFSPKLNTDEIEIEEKDEEDDQEDTGLCCKGSNCVMM